MNRLISGSRASLPTILAKGFSASSRERGDKYFMGKRVKIRLGSPTEVGALVQGSELYNVSLKWSNGKLKAGCDCPFFEEHGNLCKHIWATILAADEQGHLSEADGDRPRTVEQELPVDPSENGADQPSENVATTAGRSWLSAPRSLLDGRGQVDSSYLSQHAARTSPHVSPPAWKTQLSRIADTAAPHRNGEPTWPAHSEIVYILDVARSRATGALALGTASRGRTKEGSPRNLPKPCTLPRSHIPALPTQEDREILTLLTGADPYGSYGGYDRGSDSFSLSALMAQTVLPRIVRTRRCFLPFAPEEIEKPPLAWDDGEPWRFVLEVRGNQQNGWQLTGDFRRGDGRMAVNEPVLAIPGGIMVMRDCVAPFADSEAVAWITSLRKNGSIVVPEREREEFLGSLLGSPRLPAIDLPEELRYEEVVAPPLPCLKISAPAIEYGRIHQRMRAELSFEYEGRSVAEKAPSRGIYDASTRRFIRRDDVSEQAAAEQLQEVGLRFVTTWDGHGEWSLIPNKLPWYALLPSWVGRSRRKAGCFANLVKVACPWPAAWIGSNFMVRLPTGRRRPSCRSCWRH